MNFSHIHLNSFDNLQLYTHLWQPQTPARAIILLIHGWGEHGGRYAPMAHSLTAAGFLVAAVDLRGHGQSQGARGYINSFEKQLFPDLNQLMDGLVNSNPDLPLFLYGQSTGGGIVMGYALKQKPLLAGVIASSPWLTLATPPPQVLMATLRLMKRIYPRFGHDLGYTEGILSRDPEVDVIAQADQQMHSMMTAGLFMEAVDNGRYILDHADQFPCPLLLMHGGDDSITSAMSSQQFAQRAPAENTTFKLWPNALHELHNDIIKEEVISCMIEWINTQLKKR